jgi:hypothetical protein
MMSDNIDDNERHVRRGWSGFNNIGLCATAIAATLTIEKSMSLPKVLLIMPLVMHDSTLRFLAKGNVRERQVAAFASMNPEFIANFDKRYQDSLVVSLNAMQLLISLGYVEFDGELNLVKPFLIDRGFGKQALLIERSAKNMSALLSSSAAELYLNLRVTL